MIETTPPGPRATPRPDRSGPHGIPHDVQMSRHSFANLVAPSLPARQDNAPPTFNRVRSGDDALVSFAAMPLVGPVSVAGEGALVPSATARPDISATCSPGFAADHAPAGSVTRTPSLDLSAIDRSPASATTGNVAGHGAVLVRTAGLLTDPGKIRTLFASAIAPAPAAQSRAVTESAPLPSAPGSAGTRWSGDAPGRAAIAVHIVGDAAPRVVVRGIRTSDAERAEITGRIVRLMRSHGYAVSEQTIAIEGAGE